MAPLNAAAPEPPGANLIDKLPAEVWTGHILAQLDYGDLKTCQRVSKQLRELTLSSNLDAALFRSGRVRKERLDKIWRRAREWDEASIEEMMSSIHRFTSSWLPASDDDQEARQDRPATRPAPKLHPLVSAVRMRPGDSWTDVKVPLPHEAHVDTRESLYFTTPRRFVRVHEDLAATLGENACEPPVTRIEIVDRWAGEKPVPRYRLERGEGGQLKVRWESDSEDDEEGDERERATASSFNALSPTDTTDPDAPRQIPHRVYSRHYFPRTESEVDPEDIRRMMEQSQLDLMALGNIDLLALDGDELMELAWRLSEGDERMALEDAGAGRVGGGVGGFGFDADWAEEPTSNVHASASTAEEPHLYEAGAQTRNSSIVVESRDGGPVTIGELLKTWLEVQNMEIPSGLPMPAPVTTNRARVRFEGFAWARVRKDGTLLLGPVVLA